MTTHNRFMIVSLAVLAPFFFTAAKAADRPNPPSPASADTQSRTGDDTQKTDGKAVKRDKHAATPQKEAEKKQKDEAKRRADETQKRGTAEPRDRDGKNGDDHATRRGAEHPPQPVRPRPRVVDRAHVVFVGGYFYDPYFGEYPWWPPVIYPHPRIVFDGRAQVRLQVTPREAAVYVDGFYAGTVDDFDGFFQRLPLLSGGHTIALYLEGFGTVTRRVYLSPGSDLSIRETLVPLLPGVASESPTLAAMLPPPPEGSYIPPRTASRGTPPRTATQQASVQAVGYGVLSFRFRPLDAVVTIDGQEWITTAAGELVVHLPVGLHVVELKGNGYLMFTTQVEILQSQTTELNVAAPRPTDF